VPRPLGQSHSPSQLLHQPGAPIRPHRQHLDRPTNIYFGTTAEPSHTIARHWHVERDLTDYSSIFTVTQAGTVDLGNLVNQTYTGILHGSADILSTRWSRIKSAAYRRSSHRLLFQPTGGTVALNNTTDLLQQTLTLPTNITDVYFDVFAQSQSNDEFWYSCVPNDVGGELQSCGGTAFRESEVTIDGTPAGVAPSIPGSTPEASILICGAPSPEFRP